MQIVTPEALGAIFRALPGTPRVVVTGNFATPFTTLGLLDSSVERFNLYALNAHGPFPDRDGVTLESSFIGASMRKSPRLRYIPTRLSLAPVLFATTLPLDVVIVHTTTVVDGTVSLGVEVNVLPAAIEAVRARGGIVVAQMNPTMPYTYGDSQIPVDSIDFAIEVAEPLAVAPVAVPDETSMMIGRLVAERVADGSTLQLGIGGVPDAALAALTHRRDMRIWSEMASDGVVALEKAGAMDPTVPLTASFWFGSHEMYAWLNHNPRVRMLRTEKTNDPSLIAQQRQMTSVNTALQVDLLAQANASRIKARIYSGFGGQTDFIVGAMHAVGGQAIMALRSWHPKVNRSTVVPLLTEPTTSFQQTAIVTEQGVAELWGRSEKEQAAAIIEHAANPAARESLREAAVEMGLA